MIMPSQNAHALLVYYNLKISFPQLKETFSLAIEACDDEDQFPKVPMQIALQAHYTRQIVRPELKTFSQ